MGRSHYYVMFDGNAWKIQCDGENSDPYPDRRNALRDAVALAQLDDRIGRRAAVIVQGDDEMFRPEWDSSESAHSPPLAP